MRITDIALTTPVVGARPSAPRRAGAEHGASVVLPGVARDKGHPDEVAATALAKAAGLASAAKVVAAANQQAADSVRGDRLDEVLVP